MHIAKNVKPNVKLPEMDFYGVKFEPEKGPLGVLGEVMKLANNEQLKKDIKTAERIVEEMKGIDLMRLAKHWSQGHLRGARPKKDPNPFNVFYQK